MKKTVCQIKWTSKYTKATGVGTGKFSKEYAESIATFLNDTPNQYCHHQAIPYHPTNSNK